MRLDELLLVEQMPEYKYDVHGEVALPVRDRQPIDPGFVLTWTETPRDGDPYERTGQVLCTAPTGKTVWVVPDEPRDGEGYAVVVCNVMADNAAGASRTVGGPGDHLSTAVWQAPRLLPRALLRVDQVTYAGATQQVMYLHARADCPEPPRLSGERIEYGVAEPVDDCYVFQCWLHPVSIRPVIPSGPNAGNYVPVCGGCLRDDEPPKWKAE